MKSIFKEAWNIFPNWYKSIIGISVLLLASLIIFTCIDFFGGESFYKDGIVIEKKYQEPHDKIGTAYGVTTNGDGVVLHTREHENEKFWFIVRCNDGVYKCTVDINTYYSKQCGENITVSLFKGSITGVTYLTTAK